MKDNPFLRRSNILEKNQEYLNRVVKTISQIFAEVIKNDGKLIFAGNGGSAAEAQHMSAEYVGTLLLLIKEILFHYCSIYRYFIYNCLVKG